MQRSFRSMLAALVAVGLITGGFMLALRFVPGSIASSNQPQAPVLRVGFDPISPDEISLARDITLRNPQVADLIKNAVRTELLLIEQHEEAKSVTLSRRWDRRADVSIYRYDDNTLIQVITNLTKQTVDNVTLRTGAQIPLTANETALALQLALDDADTGPQLRTQYAQLARTPLIENKQIEASALVFIASSVPELAKGSAKTCGVDRCAQLILSLPDGQLLSMDLLVNLTTRSVVYLDR